ncbi:hypothetical protein J6590_101351, partial [Homalodisca vitripennis]
LRTIEPKYRDKFIFSPKVRGQKTGSLGEYPIGTILTSDYAPGCPNPRPPLRGSVVPSALPGTFGKRIKPALGIVFSDGEEEWLPDDIVPPSSEDEDYIVPNKKRNTGRLHSKLSGVVQSSLTDSLVSRENNTTCFPNNVMIDETHFSPHVTPEKTRKRKKNPSVSPKEKRCKSTPPQKVSEVRKTAVKQHIKEFPKYVSHYPRKDNPHTKYLSPNVTLKQIYDLYCDECKEKGDEPVKL